ncbi:type VI secretion system accessory protein TagJ [Sphingomonas sp. PR090111-T3T-6A]|uniref:type VI secretion system accessory protein TagJ n=1 Tax=Sphingomonas sp. PR090111-T3T-6A TaxID=685778 RepID=UPI000373645E|nr:type VI secretion system accessory protein TagJ [Sphingomonas sp. PR090111-T3T-6A]
MSSDLMSEAQVSDLLAVGDVATARKLLVEALRSRPDDQRARMFLFQLLCVEGEWEKARAQLRALSELSPEAQMLAAAYGRTIEGEQTRARVFAGEEPASLLVDAPAWAADLVSVRGAGAPAAAALEACPDTPGDLDGRLFDFLFDGDDRFGPMFEAIVAGRWGLVPFAVVEEISTEGPVDLRDLVWLPAEIRFRHGPALAAMLPARYPGTEREPESALRLARMTEWHEGDGLIQGVGQRVWTTSGGEDVGILSFRRIRFADPS